MDQNNLFFEKAVQNSFQNVKRDMKQLENQIFELKQLLNEQISLISSLNSKIDLISVENKELKAKMVLKEVGHPLISSGEARTDARARHALWRVKDELRQRFSNLTKKEFLVYLTLFQLEEDLKGEVKNSDLAEKLEMTESSVRSYISRLKRKGIPVITKKFNNQVVLLSIPTEFRDFNIKQKLISLYYDKLDPDQTKLIY